MIIFFVEFNQIPLPLNQIPFWLIFASNRVDTAIWMHHMDAYKTYGEKAWRQLHKIAASNIEQVLKTTPSKAAAVQPPTTHYENYQN